MSNPSTRRVAQKIRGNHGLPIGSAPQKVNEFNSCGSVNDSGERVTITAPVTATSPRYSTVAVGLAGNPIGGSPLDAGRKIADESVL